MSNPNGSSRFGGVAVLAGLVASSTLAFIWPAITESFDPFALHPNALLTLVALTMFCLGLVVKSHELSELRQRPMTVFLGVLVQCTVMPALAWLVVWTLGLEGPISYGVMLCGCVPGAMASNVLTMTARGNVSYSVSLTSVATLLSPVTVPIALTIVAGLETGSDVFKPVKMATTLLLTVVIPVIAGYLIKQRLSAVGRFAESGAPHVATAVLLWIIASVVAGNRDRLSQVAITLIVGLLIESPSIDSSSESAFCCRRSRASVPPSARWPAATLRK